MENGALCRPTQLQEATNCNRCKITSKRTISNSKTWAHRLTVTSSPTMEANCLPAPNNPPRYTKFARAAPTPSNRKTVAQLAVPATCPFLMKTRAITRCERRQLKAYSELTCRVWFANSHAQKFRQALRRT